MRILVIDDDTELADVVAAGLRRRRMAVDVAYDGATGLERGRFNDYDVIVLDRDLPGVHGDDVCAQLVAAGVRARVLMLTASGTADDLVDGLGIGADDYLAKPFDFAVLAARIGALARRAQPAVAPAIAVGEITVDSARRIALRGRRPLEQSAGSSPMPRTNCGRRLHGRARSPRSPSRTRMRRPGRCAMLTNARSPPGSSRSTSSTRCSPGAGSGGRHPA